MRSIRLHQTRRILGRPFVTGKRNLHCSASSLVEVETLKGIRVVPGTNYDDPGIEYLVQWKDDSSKTWEAEINLSPDLIRDFDDAWWNACADTDKDALKEYLHYGGEVLSQVLDENGRTALHFCAAKGRLDLCTLLLSHGADPNFPDKDGYSPLHMAAGYLQIQIVNLFLEHGADPDLPDDQGRTPLSLLIGLRDNLPADNPNALARRMALEQVISTLTNNMYETLSPVAVLDMREIGEEREYLIQWPDGNEDSWVLESDMASDVVDDFYNGMEYAEVDAILDKKVKKNRVFYLVQWKDHENYDKSWEIEDNIESSIIDQWEETRQQQQQKQKQQEQGEIKSTATASTVSV
eukprot:g3000.t1